MLELVKVLELLQTPWYLLAFVVGIALIIAAFRFNISYNLNDHFDARRKYKIERVIKKLQSVCPHACVEYDSHHPIIRSFFWRDRDDIATWPHWTCDQCGLRILNASYFRRLEEGWADNPEGLQAQQVQYEEMRDKLYKV